MGCLGHRRKQIEETADQKWDYINLNDFKARGCGPGFAYFWLWLMLIVSIAVYALDSFTAVNLLILDQWGSKIDPGIPFSISKWIFSACILLSFINLGYEAWRAIRVIKKNNVAESYLDPLAVRWESIRMGQGQGWKRFLVFAELTKGQKGAEYAALFTYFSLTSWIRVLICSAPRQVINAFTLKAVYEKKFQTNSSKVEDNIMGFFDKIGALAQEDYQQALVLSAMCFTFVVWVFSLIFLITAILIYVTFLCHWIPRADGGLNGYCERKVNARLKKVVTEKVNRALAKGQQRMMKDEFKAASKTGTQPILNRAATLPTLPDVGPPVHGDALPQMPMLSRTDTMGTLPAYSASPAPMGMYDQKRPAPSRSGTVVSTTSQGSSRAPLLGSAADMGHGKPPSPVPAVPDISLANIPPVGANRGPYGPQRSASRGTAVSSAYTDMSTASGQVPPRRPIGQPQNGYNGYERGPMPPNRAYAPQHQNPNYANGGAPYTSQAWPPESRGPSEADFHAYSGDGRASPAPSSRYSEATSLFQYDTASFHHPRRSATGPYARGPGPRYPPQRNQTAPLSPAAELDERSDASYTPHNPYNHAGADPRRNDAYGHDVESQRGNRYY